MTLSLSSPIVYPDSDGQLMADNTKQFQWIVLFKENLECLFADNPEVFVAGDLLWYPVEERPDIRVAPDVMVVFGRTKGDRGSYREWQENNIAPQVVFEILSPGNTAKEMIRKLKFYEQYGVEEYYIYDPDSNELTGLQRLEDELTIIENIENWQSPRLAIRFVLTSETLEVYYPDGRRFLTTVELAKQAEELAQKAEQTQLRAKRAEEQLAQERDLNQRLLEQLKRLNIEPDLPEQSS